MKLVTLTAFLATLATTVMASPLFEERDTYRVQSDVHSRDEPHECQQAPAGTESVRTFETSFRNYDSGNTDVGQDSLFSYARPGSATEGILSITNNETGRKVIQFISGLASVTFEIYGRQSCTVRLTFTEIDRYRVWSE